jgi:hypothetical protein
VQPIEFRRRPSTAAFMLRAFYPGRLRRAGSFPPLQATWTGHRAGGRALAELRRSTAAGTATASSSLPLLYPHVVGFPLQMVLLTHPSFPVSIWRVLQVRNHLLQRRPIGVDAVLDFSTRVSDQRTLEKGVEVDLSTTVHEGPELVWESRNTFFYRGRFGPAGPASPLAPAPDAGSEIVARWRTPAGGGLRFGRLSGDLNGIHWWNAYARILGFRRAFHHPQIVLGQCLAELSAGEPGGARRLDAWLKGPVYVGSEVSLAAREEPGGKTFALFADEKRPAIVGRWREVPEGSRLLEDAP